jgi:hypothetical protein
MSKQTSGMWQYVREIHELKGAWTRCQQLLEGVIVQMAMIMKKTPHEKSYHVKSELKPLCALV